jgi:hypothetical protein
MVFLGLLIVAVAVGSYWALQDPKPEPQVICIRHDWSLNQTDELQCCNCLLIAGKG